MLHLGSIMYYSLYLWFERTWWRFISYIFYPNLQFQSHDFIVPKNNPDDGYSRDVLLYLSIQNKVPKSLVIFMLTNIFKWCGFQIFWLWAYLMKVIPETRRDVRTNFDIYIFIHKLNTKRGPRNMTLEVQVLVRDRNQHA